jgi:hypothetical protein
MGDIKPLSGKNAPKAGFWGELADFKIRPPSLKEKEERRDCRR